MKEHIYLASANEIYVEALRQKINAADRMASLIGGCEAIDDMQRAANEYDAYSHMVEFIEALEDKKTAGMQANG